MDKLDDFINKEIEHFRKLNDDLACFDMDGIIFMHTEIMDISEIYTIPAMRLYSAWRWMTVIKDRMIGGDHWVVVELLGKRFDKKEAAKAHRYWSDSYMEFDELHDVLRCKTFLQRR